ncbi:MAG: AAA family ATPase [Acidobacteriota bacterium]
MTRAPVLFDQVEEKLVALGRDRREVLQFLGRVVCIRDLYGRVRFLLDRRPTDEAHRKAVEELERAACEVLGPRAYPPGSAVLCVDELAVDLGGDPLAGRCLDEGPPRLELLDRQVTGRQWARVQRISPPTHPPRLAFFSFKGGVGRSTAGAVLAWHLARQGKRVLVLDLDLESPGLSSALLPPGRAPELGVVDWFVEDAVGQGDYVLDRMLSRTPLADTLAGDIWLAPACGARPRNYLAKLGRCFLDLPPADDARFLPWFERLGQLVHQLEKRQKPDVVILDARAGLSDLASVVLTDLDAEVFLFALDTEATWAGYAILFDHWKETQAVNALRERLSIVAALVPETERSDYLERFREPSWDLFREYTYDEIVPEKEDTSSWGAFTFDLQDQAAPHWPLVIYWNRGFASLGDLCSLEPTLVEAAFGAYLRAMDERLFLTGEEG